MATWVPLSISEPASASSLPQYHRYLLLIQSSCDLLIILLFLLCSQYLSRISPLLSPPSLSPLLSLLYSHIYNKNIHLNYTMEWSCYQFTQVVEGGIVVYLFCF